MMPNEQPAPRKGLALWSMILGILGLPTVGCAVVGALTSIVLGIVALSKASKNPTEYGGKGMAITGIVTSVVGLTVAPFMIGIIAAIAVPSLLRARVSANEASALGDIRSMVTAEMSYAASNGGNYDTPECLAAPGSCIPGYTGPAVIDPSSTVSLKNGYRRTFHPGATAPSDAKISPSSMMTFTITAVPVTPMRTGIRGFCADQTGVICYTMDGSDAALPTGGCAPSCSIVQ
jgi:type II secretory pathway pseudopilin PulG